MTVMTTLNAETAGIAENHRSAFTSEPVGHAEKTLFAVFPNSASRGATSITAEPAEPAEPAEETIFAVFASSASIVGSSALCF
jgi:hypothetical protein